MAVALAVPEKPARSAAAGMPDDRIVARLGFLALARRGLLASRRTGRASMPAMTPPRTPTTAPTVSRVRGEALRSLIRRLLRRLRTSAAGTERTAAGTVARAVVDSA
ncbi:MAG: hypothetical protein IPN32_05610 [Deltaproteobacteria bacterium]|nr:hypothetical protein [Deltaproteobacteria bacterium]